MDQRDMAKNCGMTQQSVSQAELREYAETISIGKLRKVARAMGFEVVYFLMPQKPGKSGNVAGRKNPSTALRSPGV